MYTPRQLDTGLWVVGHPRQPGLAWSEECERWTPLCYEGDTRGWRVARFQTEQDADDYATEHELYPRRD